MDTVARYHNVLLREGFKICMLGTPRRENLKLIFMNGNGSDEDFYNKLELIKTQLEFVF